MSLNVCTAPVESLQSLIEYYRLTIVVKSMYVLTKIRAKASSSLEIRT